MIYDDFKQKFQSIIRDIVIPILIAVVLVSPLVISVVALRISKTTASQVSTLSVDYLNFATKVGTQLESINDNIDFLRDFATDSFPNITLGDTYIDKTKSKVKN